MESHVLETSSTLNGYPEPSQGKALVSLVVFQNLLNGELIRSAHIYIDGNGAMSGAQREFLLSLAAHKQISAQVLFSSLSELNPMTVKQFMREMKENHERGPWGCIFSFDVHASPDTFSLPALLDVTRNTGLKFLPSLYEDLSFVERWARGKHLYTNLCFSVLGLPSMFEEADLNPNSSIQVAEISWNCGERGLPPLTGSMSSTDSPALEEAASHNEFTSAGMPESFINLSWSLDIESPRSPYLWEWSLDRWDLPNVSSRLGLSNPELACSSTADTGNSVEASMATSSSSNQLLQSEFLTSELTTIFSDVKSPDCRESCRESIHHVLGGEELVGLLGHESSSDERHFATVSNVEHTYACRPLQTETGTPKFRSEVPDNSDQTRPTRIQLQDHGSRKAIPSFLAVCSTKDLQNQGYGELARQRAPTKRVAEMRLSELRQYFNMPINEASKRLKVGVTVLKRKCREFGVSRWPHRKIKSLDGLIHSFQESATTKEGKAKMDAALIAKELEEKRKLMEARPETKLNKNIKRLRQATFKNNFIKKRKLQLMREALSKEEGSPLAGVSEETAKTGDGYTIVSSNGAPFNIQTDTDDSSMREHQNIQGPEVALLDK